MKLLRSQRVERPFIAAVQARHPRFKAAVLADYKVDREQRGDGSAPRTRAGLLIELLRLTLSSDAFGALVLYRLKASCQRAGIPVIPQIAHRIAFVWAQVSIGDPVLIHPGVRLPHGQVVIDGFVEIHPGVLIRPFVTIGLREGVYGGPTIHRDVKIGTGAKIIGPITIGEGAKVGANTVVVHDVPAGAVVVGVPARVVG